MTKIAASIPVLRWAAARARLTNEELTARFAKWPFWLAGDAQPTLKQLEDFARLTHTAIGYFFLPQPPVLALPVRDFRTLRDKELAEPSSNLLDTLYLCQQRQDWYRDHARLHGLSALPFVGSASLQDAPESVAQHLRTTLGLSAAARRQLATWSDALRDLITKAEDAGVMVMVSSVVGSNSHRKLDVGEFRGFALTDHLAPLVFVNGADSKAAQMFTLAHELAHVWLGATGVSDAQAGEVPEQDTERWCNQVAAELLMPMAELQATYRPNAPILDEIQRLAREFKVSTLVALRRLFDAGYISRAALWQHYREEQERLRQLKERASSGGDFYRSLGARTSKRFARAIVASTLEGLTSFPEAYRMLGLRKTATFYQAAQELGVTA
ncbi:ImmA/IrrE family metallo-endopeptidase [Ramlibacter sp.]|uniref:ImmA/IrrE family metallo-endopeptidase n=1 Tax=Ramlibacter sp. TaxID=1917967 RepID=UPI0035AEE8D8